MTANASASVGLFYLFDVNVYVCENLTVFDFEVQYNIKTVWYEYSFDLITKNGLITILSAVS